MTDAFQDDFIIFCLPALPISVPAKAREGSGFPGTGIPGGCRHQVKVWGIRSQVFLERQQVLTAEPALQLTPV